MKSPTIPPEVLGVDDDELEAAKSLLAVSGGLASLPFDYALGDMSSIVRAIRDDRLQDAVDLIDVSRELDALDLEVEADTGCPVPDAAQTWRYDWASRNTRTSFRLHSVDGAYSVPLQPVRTMAVKSGERWCAEVGDLPSFGSATLEAGLKGELVVVLFCGELAIVNEDGQVLGELAAEEGQHATRHHVFCREQDNQAEVRIEFQVRGRGQVRGVWCLSTSRSLTKEEREDDPHTQDVFVGRDLLRFGDADTVGGAFCPGATPCTSDEYPHQDIVEMGGLDRASLDHEAFGTDGGWGIRHPDRSAAIITGVQAGSSSTAKGVDRPRKLVSHGEGFEFIVSIRGVTWVAVTDRKSHGESRPRLELSHDVKAPNWEPAYVTGLVAAGGSGHDVMLLNASYHHTAWTQPDSDARFLHVFFPDPRGIEFQQEGAGRARPKRPAAGTRKVVSAALAGGVRRAAAGGACSASWATVSACSVGGADVVAITGSDVAAATAEARRVRAARAR